jgi:hypothetical protein
MELGAGGRGPGAEGREGGRGGAASGEPEVGVARGKSRAVSSGASVVGFCAVGLPRGSGPLTPGY